MSYWDQRRHREGDDGRSERFESARQRTVILTFDTPEDAEAWDEAGQPLSVAAVIERTAAISRLGRGDSAGGGLSSREGRTLHPARPDNDAIVLTLNDALPL